MQGLSVFLVEDETLIRMMMVEMLEELGHRVVAEAGSIQTAEPLARTSVFDLAVFDINVAWLQYQSHRGDRCGARSAVRIRQRLWTGRRPVLFSDKPVLRKPFLIEHLLT